MSAMIPLDRYKGLIFDMDGTLIDTMPCHVESWKETSEYFDFPYLPEWLHSMGGMPSLKIVAEINQRYGLSLDPKTVATFKQRIFSRLNCPSERIHRTCDILEHYSGMKKIALGTGSLRANAIKLLQQACLLDKFDAIVTASDVERHKPYPDTFLRACDLMQLQPDECVVFEDTSLGRQAAHSGGMDCILVTEQGLEFHPVNS
jgi:beta-phosphoglucomutase family hydrolase